MYMLRYVHDFKSGQSLEAPTVSDSGFTVWDTQHNFDHQEVSCLTLTSTPESLLKVFFHISQQYI